MTVKTPRVEIPAGDWAVDPVHSSIHFAVSHSGVATFRSGFDAFEATLRGGEAPRLEGSVEVESIRVEEPQQKAHLLSADFFDAERHPRLRFASRELTVAADGAVQLTGDLGVGGETRSVAAAGRFAQIGADVGGGERLGLSLEAKVDRRDFGIDWNADLPNGGQALQYEVTINVELEFVAAETGS